MAVRMERRNRCGEDSELELTGHNDIRQGAQGRKRLKMTQRFPSWMMGRTEVAGIEKRRWRKKSVHDCACAGGV